MTTDRISGIQPAGGQAGMNALQAIAIAVLQGATELFPVSSLGHAVDPPRAPALGRRPARAPFLPFLVMLHLGTAAGAAAVFLAGLVDAR